MNAFDAGSRPYSAGGSMQSFSLRRQLPCEAKEMRGEVKESLRESDPQQVRAAVGTDRLPGRETDCLAALLYPQQKPQEENGCSRKK